MLEEYDDEMIRCPRVGGYVNFKFCRSENNMLPCRWVIGCWQGRMDIIAFLDNHFSEADLERIFLPPKPKLESLVEMIERGRKTR